MKFEELSELLKKRVVTLEDMINALTILAEMEEDEECRGINHQLADELLLSYIGDKKITELFHKIKKWYA